MSEHCFDVVLVIKPKNLMQGWPVNKQDIIVSTPAALLNNIDHKAHCTDFLRGVKYVVCFHHPLFFFIYFQKYISKKYREVWIFLVNLYVFTLAGV